MNRHTRGVVCTLVGGILWGFSGTCGQFLFSNYQVDSSWLTVMRMLGAGVALGIFCLFRQRKSYLEIWKEKRDGLQVVLFAVCGLLFSQYTYLTAISWSNAATATVLQYVGPVLVMIVICLRNRRKPGRMEFLAIFLAVLGTFLLATHGNPATMVLSKEGLFWGLLSAISLACYTLLPTKIIPRWGNLVVSGYGMLIGGVVMALVSRFWRLYVPLDLKGWVAVAGIVILGTLFAFTMYLQGVADIGAVKASMLASVEPVSSTIIAAVWLHTKFIWIDILGFICILTTVFLLAKKDTQS